MPQAVTITGTRSTGHRNLAEYRELFEDYVRPFAQPGVRFHLGGASGIDSLALLWLAGETDTELVVAVPAKLADQPADARHAVETARVADRLTDLVELGGQTRTAGYHARNRWMVDRSQLTIGFPHTASGGGTWYTLDYTASQDKPRLIVPV
ncbi:hypothetical protein [Actinomadura latina]|uniref:DNA recombination-mediator protein A n=1 Tax=Actinomadura latina TaxID=163603 RepID=A0A846YXI5_9ACTN|nr:hypothetical protein [Actinomadura latina]NKZ03304.1 hypothetical protein [Actinomadura latina]